MKRILVTGASRGIGRALAVRLAEAGSHLFLHGRDQEALVETYTEVERRGSGASILLHDLSDPSEIEALLGALGDASLDVLINNAGVGLAQPLEMITLAAWQHSIAVNITAPFVLTQRLSARMPRGSSIVNILSTAARTPIAGWSGYCMSKFALDGFSRAIREELRPRGIRVINVYPGATDTDIWEEIPGEWPRAAMMAPAEVAEAVAFALARPSHVLVEDIVLARTAGPV